MVHDIDIFLSYAREDRDRIKPIVTALGSCGWSVWWDREILPGKSYAKVIAEVLKAARCVVVVWSRDSIDSDWVLEEIEQARRKRTLVPCALDDIEPPTGFVLLQTANLVNWNGEMPHDGMGQLLKGVAQFCPEARRAAAPSADTGHGPVIRVDRNNADLNTIEKAVRMAGDGDRVLIPEGVYRESLFIERRVEIVGDGARDHVIIESCDDNVIAFEAEWGRIANLTIRFMGRERNAVKTTKGGFVLEDCDITSFGLSAISIQHNARPTIRRSRIYNSHQEGIWIADGGSGLIESNEIYMNGLAGIAIYSGASPIVFRNDIYACKEGIYIDGGRGSVEGNRIHDNRGPAIKIKSGEPAVGQNEAFSNNLVGD